MDFFLSQKSKLKSEKDSHAIENLLIFNF